MPVTSRISVVIVDDHDLFRTGMAELLSGQPDLEVIAQGSNGQMGMRLARELRPDVVLLDMQMPDMSGLQVTQALLEEQPDAKIVLLTVVSDDDAIAAAMEAGACGFLVKDTPVSGVAAAIRAAAEGASWLSPRAAEVVLGRLRQRAAAPEADATEAASLSDRELEVLRLIAQGQENAEIAQTLGISPLTAKNHVSNILAKLGVPGRVQAAIYAVRQGLA
jgi:NarL family two-component system response regulator LiaR